MRTTYDLMRISYYMYFDSAELITKATMSLLEVAVALRINENWYQVEESAANDGPIDCLMRAQ